MQRVELSRMGEVEVVVEMGKGGVPERFEWCAPYLMAYVVTEDNLRVPAMMTDVVQETETGNLVMPAVGTKVELVVRRLYAEGEERGIIVYGQKAREVIEPATEGQIEAIRAEIASWMQR